MTAFFAGKNAIDRRPVAAVDTTQIGERT